MTHELKTDNFVKFLVSRPYIWKKSINEKMTKIDEKKFLKIFLKREERERERDLKKIETFLLHKRLQLQNWFGQSYFKWKYKKNKLVTESTTVLLIK